MRVPATITAPAAVLAALAIAACGSGSGNGVASKSPDQIIAASTRAIDAVHSVRVSGSVADGAKDTIELDLHLVSGKGATGSMAENGLSFKLITVNDTAYIDGSPSFWKQFAGGAAAQLLPGKWLKAPANRGDFASFSSLGDLKTLVSGLLTGHGALTKGGESTVAGRRVVALHDPSKHGTLYVAVTGPPYPIRIVNTGSGGGQIDFSAFDQPVSLAAPAHSIDIDALKK